MKKLILITLLFCQMSFSQDVNLETFATGFNRPVNIQHANDDRLFIVEQDGIIKIVESNGTTLSTPFLNIDNLVRSAGNEQGLLGLAFHPDYATNGYFFVNYINNSSNTVIARYTVSSNANIANVNSAQILLTIDQPYSNHNGGNIAFRNDGYLYIGMGDGGSAGDPQNNSQNGQSLLGKMLRIDVDGALPYTIPADNPFVNDANILDEIWATGLRNPWKFSFDRLNNDLWIGDVGQNSLEEINHTVNGLNGLNYGWRCYEGNSTYNTGGCSNSSNYVFPVAQYSQGGNPYKCSITGGYVYRGTQYPDFYGLYFFTDYCSNQIGTIDPNNSYQITWNNGFTGNFSSFGEDQDGELYVAGLQNGIIYKIKDDTLNQIDEVINDAKITPNPVKDTFEIQTNNLTILQVELFDINGKKLKAFSKNELNNLSVSNLSKGIYFVSIQFENNKSMIKKMVKTD